MKLYQNKYRIPSARLQNWDYGSDGAYFITICTRDRMHYFGEIKNNEMHLNQIGKLAYQYWEEIPQHFPHIELGNFVVMPNHVHGILIVNNPISSDSVSHRNPVETLHCNVSTNISETTETLHCNVSTDISETTETLHCNVCTASESNPESNPESKSASESHPNPLHQKMAQISPKAGSISTIIRSYKSVVSKNARLILPDFGWHPRFHDHIIRDGKAFENIQNYIVNNPSMWKEDKFSK